MSKPIIRWTLGAAKLKSSYRILDKSIRSILNLYADRFDYYVLYNDDVKEYELNCLIEKHKNVRFLKQDWGSCPIRLKIPSEYYDKTNKYFHDQRINGSFWKICPPRLNRNLHEIILDNDLIFLKRPKAIEEFLCKNNKNSIIKDSNKYLGLYENLFENEKQGYNSGIIGLHPNYDFEKDLTKNAFRLNDCLNDNDYGNEQGLLMYTLYCTDPIIGSSEDFVGIHNDKIFLNCVPPELSNSTSLISFSKRSKKLSPIILSNSTVSSEKYRQLKEKDFDKKMFLHFFYRPNDRYTQAKLFNDLKRLLDKKAPNATLLTKKESFEIIKQSIENAEVIHFLSSNRFSHFPWKYFKSRYFI